MVGNGWECQGMGGNVGGWLEIMGIGWEWVGMVGNVRNGWKLWEMLGNG